MQLHYRLWNISYKLNLKYYSQHLIIHLEQVFFWLEAQKNAGFKNFFISFHWIMTLIFLVNESNLKDKANKTFTQVHVFGTELQRKSSKYKSTERLFKLNYGKGLIW